MKKIVPSTPCKVGLVIRRVNSLVRTLTDHTKFGYIRDMVNVAIATHDRPGDPIQSIDINITIGE